ncbi:hypothetical protein DXG01_010640 [Tephrocybe rancida]|nr:hypothetical protein DXG01_010640 [Tephrocybe rancida]
MVQIVKTSGKRTISQQSRVALYYLTAMTFNLVIWTARLSILATIMRFRYYTAYLRAAAGLFCVAIMVLLAQLLWCALGKGVAITQVTIRRFAADAFADVVLVGAPLLILRNLKSGVAKAQRIRLSVSFAVGGLTTVVSTVHAYYILKNDPNSVVFGSVELFSATSMFWQQLYVVHG